MILRSLPGLGAVLGARVLAEFGDSPTRFHDARARKNFAGTARITRASGKHRSVQARYAFNKRLLDVCDLWAFCAITASPGARRYYDALRARGVVAGHGRGDVLRLDEVRGHHWSRGLEHAPFCADASSRRRLAEYGQGRPDGEVDDPLGVGNSGSGL